MCVSEDFQCVALNRPPVEVSCSAACSVKSGSEPGYDDDVFASEDFQDVQPQSRQHGDEKLNCLCMH